MTVEILTHILLAWSLAFIVINLVFAGVHFAAVARWERGDKTWGNAAAMVAHCAMASYLIYVCVVTV